MAYRKFILQGAKLHGPYYYANYIDNSGNVRSHYLGTYERQALELESQLHAMYPRAEEPSQDVIDRHLFPDEELKRQQVQEIPLRPFEEVQEQVRYVPPVKRSNPLIPFVLGAVVIFLFTMALADKAGPGITGYGIAIDGGFLNRAPVIDLGVERIYLDGQASINLSNYAADPDGQRLVFASSVPEGIVVMQDRDVFTLIPQDGFSGEVEIIFLASDGEITSDYSIILEVP